MGQVLNFRIARNPLNWAVPLNHVPQADLPDPNAPNLHFVLGSSPLTDGAGPSRDVKTMIARSIVGANPNQLERRTP
jgi:hypothetical protein